MAAKSGKRRAAAAPNKRRGLRRLECEGLCGAVVYATWAQLEGHGVPRCSCGARFLPDDLELALELALEDAPVVSEYRAQCASIVHGQGFAGGLQAPGHRDWKAPEEIAWQRVEKMRREGARERRLNALRPAAEPMPF